MSERVASDDAAFREALDAYHDALLGCQCTKCGGGDPADAAHARVLALYAEIVAERDDLMAIAIGDKVRKPSNPSLAERQGEVCTVMDSEWHLGPIVALGGYYKPGQRVRVVRCEESPNAK